ncbi:hypothetical protein R3W88_021297 [Solanum pinnatisectum]|uniref:Hexosyltransferase n=1 Tax=Solanum pinnatisectum TaxID=50273 RepID=A0AAV9LTG9_9SOLN|nr:hypothetical protein R3W88_021297 [Solanum pinnatisectum]
MTLDVKYFRGSVAAVHSVLKNSTCPENVYFHFVASKNKDFQNLRKMVKSIFPSLSFKVYSFNEFRVKKLISSSIRLALDNPLNYARTYLAKIIQPCVERVIYLDFDVVLVDDIQKLWPIYWFKNYWSSRVLSSEFQNIFYQY